MSKADFELKELGYSDLSRGFLDLINEFTGSNTTPAEASQIFDKLPANQATVVAVIKNHYKVIGTGTVRFEQKFSHGGRKAGHIEDVVVDSNYRGQGIGSAIVTKLIEEAKQRSCYKVVLNCNDQNIGFYQKLGMERSGNCMRINL